MNVFLVAEIVVKQRLVDARGASDRRGARARQTALGENCFGGAKDASNRRRPFGMGQNGRKVVPQTAKLGSQRQA